LYIPDTLLMSFELSFLSETTSIPQLNLPIVRPTSNNFVIRRHSHNVDAFLMAHYGHLGRCYSFQLLLVFGGFPNLNSVVRTARNKELTLARGEGTVLNSFRVPLEYRDTLESLLEG
jgi:hypothetical protein